MQLSVISLVYLIAFSHAVFIAISLWQQSKQGQSGRVLAVVIGIMAYKLLEGGVMYSSLHQTIPHVALLMPGAVLWLGPVFYQYVRTISGAKPLSAFMWFLHFIPSLSILYLSSHIILMPTAEKAAFITQLVTYEGPSTRPLKSILIITAIKLHLATYLFLSWRKLKLLERTAENHRSDQSALTLNKIKWFCLALIALETVWVILFGLQQSRLFLLLDVISEVWLLFIAGIVMVIGYYGLRQPRLLFSQFELSLLEPVETVSSENNSDTNTQASKTEKYHQSSIPDSTANEIVTLINHVLLEQKLYLNDKLTLALLSEAVEVKPHLLSQVINQVMKTNFYKLINKYRVQHAISFFEIDNGSWSIERVALESGFGNRVTFNKAFKEVMGVTASGYKKSLQQAA